MTASWERLATGAPSQCLGTTSSRQLLCSLPNYEQTGPTSLPRGCAFLDSRGRASQFHRPTPYVCPCSIDMGPSRPLPERSCWSPRHPLPRPSVGSTAPACLGAHPPTRVREQRPTFWRQSVRQGPPHNPRRRAARPLWAACPVVSVQPRTPAASQPSQACSCYFNRSRALSIHRLVLPLDQSAPVKGNRMKAIQAG